MLKNQLRILGCCAIFTAFLGACSGDKVLPSGKRISVLDQTSDIRSDVTDGAAHITIPATMSNRDWLQSNLDAAHVLHNFQAGTDFKKMWKADFGTGSSKREFLISTPLVKNGVVYTLDADGKLNAFNLKDGEKMWSLSMESENRKVNATSLKGSGIAIYSGNIYVTTGFGVVAAVDLKTQKKVWEQNLRSPLRISPVAANGKVFVQSVDNKFFALDALSGEVLWQYDIAMENTTMVGGAQAAYDATLDTVITGFSNGELQAFNATLGVPLWSDILVANRRAYSSTFLHSLKASPIVENEKVYALGSSGVFVAIDGRSGERMWEKEIGGTATPLLVADTLYAITDDKYLVALNKQNGDILWSTKITTEGLDKNAVFYTPLMVNSRLLVTVSDGHVISYNPKDGKLLKVADLDENLNSAPIVADGYIVFTTSKAKLLVFK